MISDALPYLPLGLHLNVPAHAYHADPAATPSASSGILRLLLDRSPAHAKHAHPRLNPAYEATPATDAMNRGTILHALTLGTEAPFEVLDVEDYRSTVAKALKAETIAAGLIPVKQCEMEELEDVASAMRERLRGIPEVWAGLQDAITSDMAEATLIWQEDGALCRCRFDTLPAKRFGVAYDFKFTGLSAEPGDFGKKVATDLAIQADFYPRAVQAIRGDRPLFVFVACETEAPYGVSLHALDPEAADLARQKVDEALVTWMRCLASGQWPSYPSLIHYHGPKPWDVNAWDERQGLARQARQFTPKPTQAEVARGNAFTRKMIEAAL